MASTNSGAIQLEKPVADQPLGRSFLRAIALLAEEIRSLVPATVLEAKQPTASHGEKCSEQEESHQPTEEPRPDFV